MENHTNTVLQQLIALEPIKTWSVIVTLLGDMEQARISGKTIGRLLGHVGLKPEATRVALHRLKKDDWISTNKTGREVIYQLSDSGLAATQAAYDDVYRTTPKYRGGWKLLLVENDNEVELVEEHAIRVTKQVYLLPESILQTDFAGEFDTAMQFDVNDQDIPTWIVNRIVPGDVIDIAERLNVLAVEYAAQNPQAHKVGDVAIRLLLLHRWRKMALREGTWALIGLFPDGPMAQCHRSVTELLQTSPRIAIERT